ncbi:MAG TPA: phosphodiester glycosidase family protein [Fimbriimonas sp.]
MISAAAVAKPVYRPVAYASFRRSSAVYHSVTADLSSKRVQAKTIHVDGLTSPWSLVSLVQPAAAITGTFFAPGIGTPVADVLIEGELVAKGNRGSALAVDYLGNVSIIDRPYLRAVDWEGYRFGLRGAVRLISNGKVNPNPKAQRFRDPRIWGSASRTGVGITSAGKLVLMATPNNVTLSQFGNAMRSRGVVDAVSLDGGGSTCLYYRGTMVVPTGRGLSNMFVVQEAP